MANRTLALILDVENMSPAYLEEIVAVAEERGNIAYRLAFGSFSIHLQHSCWLEKLAEHNFLAVDVPRFHKQKNAADMTIALGAMQLLYTSECDGFAIATNDSDFTDLITHLRAGGAYTFGIGTHAASHTLIKAYDSFHFVRENSQQDAFAQLQERLHSPLNLREEIQANSSSSQYKPCQAASPKHTTSVAAQLNAETMAALLRLRASSAQQEETLTVRQAAAEERLEATAGTVHGHERADTANPRNSTADNQTPEIVYSALRLLQNGKKWVGLSELGSTLRKINPDFNPKSFGASSLAKLLTKMDGIEIKAVKSNGVVRSYRTRLADVDIANR